MVLHNVLELVSSESSCVSFFPSIGLTLLFRTQGLQISESPEYLCILTYARSSTPRYDRGDVSFIIACGALVFFMVPGVGESQDKLVQPLIVRLSYFPTFSFPLFWSVT